MDEHKKPGLWGVAPRRKALGLTQEALAAALGIERGRLAMWETGTWPSAQWLPKLAELLHCSIGELFEAPTDPIIDGEEGKDHEP